MVLRSRLLGGQRQIPSLVDDLQCSFLTNPYNFDKELSGRVRAPALVSLSMRGQRCRRRHKPAGLDDAYTVIRSSGAMTISSKEPRESSLELPIACGTLHRFAEWFGDEVLQALRRGFVVEATVGFVALGVLLLH